MISLLLLLMPLIGSVLVLAGPKRNATIFATVLALLELGTTVWAYFHFSNHGAGDFLWNIAWIPNPAVNFHIGLDGISMLMIGLTNITIPFIIFSANNRPLNRPRSFFSLVLFMQFALIGVFLSLDGLLYYIFWELTLIPAYFILLYWGVQRKSRVTLKFFIYTLAGSLFMMLGFIYLYTVSGLALSTESLYNLNLNEQEQNWLFWAFFLAFAIKVPIIPFHTWQADTYSEAPTQGTMLLSALMAKMGLFSLVRWLVPLFPDALEKWGFLVITLCVIGIVYGSILAIYQKDLKRLFAYASLAHMGLMAAGIFTLNKNGMEGSMVQAFAHGINTVGLFVCADLIYSRTQTLQFDKLGGIRNVAPVFSACFFIIMLATIALPFTNSFVGELVVLYGIFEYNAWLAGLAVLSLVFGAVYMLRMYKKAMLGETTPETAKFQDLTISERWVLFPLVGMIFLFGVLYQPLFNLTGPAIEYILMHTFN